VAHDPKINSNRRMELAIGILIGLNIIWITNKTNEKLRKSKIIQKIKSKKSSIVKVPSKEEEEFNKRKQKGEIWESDL
jgi:vacuolar-type H+-ATPase subunit F/Vma7